MTRKFGTILIVFAVAALLAITVTGTESPSSDHVVVFYFTGRIQYFDIPSYVRSFDLQITGASGGFDNCNSLHEKWSGGKGLTIDAKIGVPHGLSRFYINVGGIGSSRHVGACGSRQRSGGYNGGGASAFFDGGAGGGSSDLRLDLDAKTRIVVAAGGGGGSSFCRSAGECLKSSYLDIYFW
jgi:hypothetical protein